MCNLPHLQTFAVKYINHCILVILTWNRKHLKYDIWLFVFLTFFAGGTISEEKQKDAGHFDPVCHSHCSNYYSFWNKVLVMHSSGVSFLCGCLLCICVDLHLVLVLLKTKLNAFHIHQETTRRIPCLFAGALWAMLGYFVVHFNERNNQESVWAVAILSSDSHLNRSKTLWRRYVKPNHVDISVS